MAGNGCGGRSKSKLVTGTRRDSKRIKNANLFPRNFWTSCVQRWRLSDPGSMPLRSIDAGASAPACMRLTHLCLTHLCLAAASRKPYALWAGILHGGPSRSVRPLFVPPNAHPGAPQVGAILLSPVQNEER
jgi:hypothetical protein